MYRTTIAALTLAFALPTAAVANEGPKSGLFKEFDTNGDAVISRAEATASKALSAAFDRVDANGDGRIVLREFVAATQTSEEVGDGGA